MNLKEKKDELQGRGDILVFNISCPLVLSGIGKACGRVAELDDGSRVAVMVATMAGLFTLWVALSEGMSKHRKYFQTAAELHQLTADRSATNPHAVLPHQSSSESLFRRSQIH